MPARPAVTPPSFLPVAPALKPMVQRVLCDGRRMGLVTPFEPQITQLLRECGASWFAPCRAWVVLVDQLRELLEKLAAAQIAGYALGDARVMAVAAWRAPTSDVFTSLLDLQILPLRDGGFAVSSEFDALVVQAMQSLGGRFHRRARVWELRVERQSVLAALAEITGVDETFIFVHEAEGVLEDFSGAKSSEVPISVPASSPPRGASGAGPGDEAGSKFLSAFGLPLQRIEVNEVALAAATQACGLRDYQVAGVRHLLGLSSGLLADDMGLGKTRQAVVAGRLAAGADKVLVACPASLSINWQREILAAYPGARVALIGQHSMDDVRQADWIVANYERLGGLVRETSMRIGAMLVDECHYLKEHQSGRTRNAFLLAERVPRRFLLTGTPVLSREVEVHTLLRLSGHPLGAMPLKDFRHAFAGSAERRADLAERVSEWMLRRGKDVLKDLGDKFHQVRHVKALDGLAGYRQILNDSTLQAMPKITKLRQHLESIKLPFLLEAVQAMPADGKAIIFCEYMETVEQLRQGLMDAGLGCVSLVGTDATKKRMLAVDAFQQRPEVRVFIGTTQAAGVGITLTAANYVFFASLPWTPALKRQAEDRAYRSGQTRDVFVIIPLVVGTIDERCMALLDAKREIEVAVVESNREAVAS